MHVKKIVFFFQEKSILKTRPVLHEAVAAARASASLSSAAAMVVADLGCSSGPNTLLVVSEVLGEVAGRRSCGWWRAASNRRRRCSTCSSS